MLSATSAALIFAMTIIPPLNPRQPAKPDPKTPAIAVLDQWEKRVKETKSFIARDVVLTDGGNGPHRTWKGEVRYIRPNHVAIRMIDQNDNRNYELMIQNGNQLYEYRPQTQKLVIHELQSDKFDLLEVGRGLFLGSRSLWPLLVNKDQVEAQSFHDDLSRLTAGNEIIVTRDIGADNPHYIYIEVTPKTKEYKREFSKLQLVFHASTMHLRRLWIEQPSGTEVTWDFPSIDTVTEIKPADFAPPPLSKGWQTETLQLPILDQIRP